MGPVCCPGESFGLLSPNQSVGRDFPGGPVVKTLHSQMQGQWGGRAVRSLVWEIRSCMPHLMAKTYKKTNQMNLWVVCIFSRILNDLELPVPSVSLFFHPLR